MNNLGNDIYAYYLTHHNELTLERQFHFASRLYLWRSDTAGRDLLRNLRPWFTSNNKPEDAIQEILALNSANVQQSSKNAMALRQPYFERYPKLRAYVSILFRITFLYTIYGIDCRPKFLELFPLEEIEVFSDRLANDPSALSILSTHEVNFFYLYNRVIQPDTSLLRPEMFLELRRHYDMADPVQIQLLIYLYTHCVLGESMFYYRALPHDMLPPYRKMMDELEEILDERFVDINLDNKCEFLVSCQLVGYKSRFEQAIFQEASQSVSSDGYFIIDRHNNNPQNANITLEAAEHRNVLLIMAQSQFSPDGRPAL